MDSERRKYSGDKEIDLSILWQNSTCLLLKLQTLPKSIQFRREKISKLVHDQGNWLKTSLFLLRWIFRISVFMSFPLPPLELQIIHSPVAKCFRKYLSSYIPLVFLGLWHFWDGKTNFFSGQSFPENLKKFVVHELSMLFSPSKYKTCLYSSYANCQDIYDLILHHLRVSQFF